jgi:hypothetical protein
MKKTSNLTTEYILNIKKSINKIDSLLCSPSNFDKEKLLLEGSNYFLLSNNFYNHLDEICNE